MAQQNSKAMIMASHYRTSEIALHMLEAISVTKAGRPV